MPRTHEPNSCSGLFIHGYASPVNDERMPMKQDGDPVLDVFDVIPRFDYLD